MQFSLLCRLTLKSLLNRKFTAALVVFSIMMSVCLLLSVETVRTQAKQSFTSTVSNTDLIVGARAGSVQLLLYSVFRIGNATNNIDWQSYQTISSHPSVAWTIPVSLGDSHKGYRVMGTDQGYFEHFQYGLSQALEFAKGQRFENLYDTVVGAEVAKALGYKVGDLLALSHGAYDTEFASHDDKPFTLVGILEPTGTPVDQTVFVSLEGIEALHVDWKSGVRSRNTISAEEAAQMDLQPTQITAMFVGLKSKAAVFKLQRAINKYPKEPLLAILPGIALGELWQLVGVAENALFLVGLFVLINSLVVLLAMMLASLEVRRREVSILRSLGCRPGQIFVLLLIESGLLALLGCLLGLLLHWGALLISAPVLQSEYGLIINASFIGSRELMVVAGIIVSSVLLGAIPGYRIYKRSVADGMSVRM